MTESGRTDIRKRWTVAPLFVAALQLVFAALAPPRATADGAVGVIDVVEAAKTHLAFLVGPDKLDLAPTESDKAAIDAQEKKVKALRQRLASERTTMSQADREALQQAIQKETAALQTRYASNTKEKFFDRLRWRSPDIFYPHLSDRLQEYGRESGLTLILNKGDDRQIYHDPGRSGDVTGERIDLTGSFIEWLRRKDGSLAEGSATTPTPSGR